jgi:hypothetical protein
MKAAMLALCGCLAYLQGVISRASDLLTEGGRCPGGIKSSISMYRALQARGALQPGPAVRRGAAWPASKRMGLAG